MPPANLHYHRALESFAKAIEFDERKERKRAIRSYTDAGEAALLGLKLDQVEQSRIKMIDRVRSWIERAERLKVEEKLSNIPKIATSPNKISQPFEEVVGLENVKQSLREAIILPQFHPHLFTEERRPWKGILLFGPPGTGKTLLASSVAKEASCNFIAISSSDLVSKYLGDSERAVKELFQKALESVQSTNKRCVLFFDEIDSIGGKRTDDQKESERRLLTELLKQMDGVGSSSDKIVVMGATNLPQNLDPALRRRFERRLYVPLPGLLARCQLIAKYLGIPGIDHQFTAREVVLIARKTRGFSGADIASLCNEILLGPVRVCLASTHFIRKGDGSLVPCSANTLGAVAIRMLDKQFDSKSLRIPFATIWDAQFALTKVKPSTNPREIVKLLEFSKQFANDDHTDLLLEEENVDENKAQQYVTNFWLSIGASSSEDWVSWASNITTKVVSNIKRNLVAN